MAKQTPDQVLVTLVKATGDQVEGLGRIGEKSFTDSLALYLTSSKALMAAAKVYGTTDEQKLDPKQDTLDAIEAAVTGAGLKWGMNDAKSSSTISRLRNLRWHRAETLIGFGQYQVQMRRQFDLTVRRDIASYSSYLGKLNFRVDGKPKPLVTLAGNLTAEGKRRHDAKIAKDAAKAAANVSGFNFSTWTTETGVAKAVSLKALIHDAMRELRTVTDGLDEKGKAKVSADFGKIVKAKTTV